MWINGPDDKKTNSSETRLRQQGLGPTAKGQRSEITASPSTGRLGNPTPTSCGNTFRFIASSEVKRSHFHVASRGVKRPARVRRGGVNVRVCAVMGLGGGVEAFPTALQGVGGGVRTERHVKQGGLCGAVRLLSEALAWGHLGVTCHTRPPLYSHASSFRPEL